jgi:hypothetical protein
MNTLFIVSSAIHTKYGTFTEEQRLNQTIETFKSIQEHDSTAKILLNDAGAEKSITKKEAELLNPYLCGILSYFEDEQVQQIYNAIDNADIVKNYTEMLTTAKTLNFILQQQPQIIQNINRIFKISGRYKLNDNFDINKFSGEDIADKYIFSSRKLSQFPPQLTGGLTYQFMSRLWSWPTNKTTLVLYRYNLMLEYFQAMIDKHLYVDIEHLLLKFFDGPNIVEYPSIGIEGAIAPNGNAVKD